ncbi:hypothetical protein GCM10010187_11850 [Actinomadura coerulea]|nr:hypothetical protein GCM10010187_11850 [Actinomadura coerulea]
MPLSLPTTKAPVAASAKGPLAIKAYPQAGDKETGGRPAPGQGRGMRARRGPAGGLADGPPGGGPSARVRSR